jgi:5-methylcytosine-specific restriction protein A
MPVDMGLVEIGNRYNRDTLARIWGYKGRQALEGGIFTPARQKIIVLFITKKKKKSRVQYEDDFDGETLSMEGELKHGSDDRLARSLNRDEVHLFYRETHIDPYFIYYGLVFLREARLHSDKPSHFIFNANKSDFQAISSLTTELTTHGDATFVPDSEGKRHLRQHVEYERSRKNRARAIEIHGTTCQACGFSFDRFYGARFSRSYIEIHHVRSITEINGLVNPKTDLSALCSNCHSMAHRTPGTILSVNDLKRLIQEARESDEGD